MVQMSRKELYDLVWSVPMSVLCKRFGLSDNGLRKRCKAMNIPMPSLGYWAKRQNGKKTEIVPLPPDYPEGKESTVLRENGENSQKVDLTPETNRWKLREQEIRAGDVSVFVVPEVLYAKDPLIIDTKEKLRDPSQNKYLQKNPYKSRIKSTLQVEVSPQCLDRALCIFSTILNALRFRGHAVKIENSCTYALVKGGKFNLRIYEKMKEIAVSEISSDRYQYSGNLIFGISDERGSWHNKMYKDTVCTKLEEKIIPIIAELEIRAEIIQEEKLEAERRRIQEEEERRKREEAEREERRKREEFRAKRQKEIEKFGSLFEKAERLHQADVLREYVRNYEERLAKEGEITEEMSGYIQWAKDKIDWLDPFIAKPDPYLDSWVQEEEVRVNTSQSYSQKRESYDMSTGYSFWRKPYWRKK